MKHFPVSDHYDGKRFHNTGGPAPNGLWDGAKMLLALDMTPWPEALPHAPALEIHAARDDGAVAVTIVNHATVLLQAKGVNILTDPVWSERVSPVSWLGPKRHRQPGIPFAGLPRIDAVLISHNHYDHLDLATLARLDAAHHPVFIVPLGCADLLRASGIGNVVELDWWASRDIGPHARVHMTPAHHFSGRGVFDRDRSLWASYYLLLDGQRIYFGGDTAYADHFGAIRARFGSPDIALLPIGAYQPEWFMRRIHMNPDDAVRAHHDLQAGRSIAIHHRTFQLTGEGAGQPEADLLRAVRDAGMPADAFQVLEEGRTRLFNRAPAAPAGSSVDAHAPATPARKNGPPSLASRR